MKALKPHKSHEMQKTRQSSSRRLAGRTMPPGSLRKNLKTGLHRHASPDRPSMMSSNFWKNSKNPKNPELCRGEKIYMYSIHHAITRIKRYEITNCNSPNLDSLL